MENRINPTAAIKTGWSLTKEHFIVSLGLVLGYTVISCLLSFIPTTGVLGFAVQLLSFAVSCVWTLGITRITANAVDGEEPQFSMIGEVMPRFWSMVVLMLLMFAIVLVPIIVIFVVAVILGFGVEAFAGLTSTDPVVMMEALQSLGLLYLIVLIPCIYIGIRFCFVNYLLVDRGMGAVDALKASWTATSPIQGKIFVFLVLSFLITIAGLLCFIVGVFVSMIILMYAQAALYRQAFPAGMQDPLIVEDVNVAIN